MTMDLGPHAVFIWTSYAIVIVVLAALVAWLIHDGRRQQRRLLQLEARGLRRWSAGGSTGEAG
jgi:heme exporter protein D